MTVGQNNRIKVVLLLCMLAAVVWFLFARKGVLLSRAITSKATAASECSSGANRREPRERRTEPQSRLQQENSRKAHEDVSGPSSGLDAAAILTIRFVDESGSAVASVQCWLQERGKNASFSVANNEGILDLHTSIGSTVQVQACGQPTKLDMGGGSYRLEPSYSAPWASRQYEFRVVTARQYESIRVYAAKDLLVRALYDDGQAYVGTYSVHYERIVRCAHQSSTDGATVCGIPIRDGVVLHIPAQRVAYDAVDHAISFSELSGEAPLVVVIPRSKNPTGGMRLEFDGYNDSMVEIVLGISPQREFMSTGNEHRTSDPWLSRPLQPGMYSVVVSGSYASRIDNVQIKGGEITTVRAVAAAPSAVRARVLNATTRQPVARAVLELSGSSFPNFESLFPIPGVRTVSDTKGVAVLAGTAPGIVSVTLEAVGFNPKTLQVHLSAGGEADLGDIYLEEAHGVCVVKISGMKLGAHYAIIIRQIGSSGAYPWRPVEREIERIEGLVLGRRYSIGVVLSGGGEIIYQDIVPNTPDVPIEIELDASKSVNPIDIAED